MTHEAAPFALALLEIGQESDKALAFGQQLEEVAKVFDDNMELQMLLKHPKIPADQKYDLLEKLFKEDCDEIFMHFLQIVCNNNAAGSLSKMAEEYQRLYDESQNIKSVNVTSASSLDDKQVQALKAMLEKKLQGPVRLEIQVDPALIAGLKIQADGLSMDNSVASRLAAMKEALHRH